MQLYNMKNIKTIIFDLGGVILDINYQNTIEAFKKIGVKNPKYFYTKAYQINLFNNLETGSISNKEFLQELKKETNGDLKAIKKAWNAMILNLPIDRIDVLQKLKKKYSIFLLSNTNDIHISKFKNNIGESLYYKFYNLFEKVYYSHKIGLRKPDEKIFKLIINENKLIPNQVLFIDDSPQHIEAAKGMGIKTYHLTDEQDISNLFPGIFL